MKEISSDELDIVFEMLNLSIPLLLAVTCNKESKIVCFYQLLEASLKSRIKGRDEEIENLISKYKEGAITTLKVMKDYI